MNERIKQLAEQACFDEIGKDYSLYFNLTKDKVEKFAELLVKECTELAKHHVMNISTYRDAEFVARQIKQHFDAEEYNPNLKEKNK